MMDGKDVDLVLNGHDLTNHFSKEGDHEGETFIEQFDTVLCMNTLEHDDKFWLTLDGINHVLKQGGLFIFAQPTLGFPIHNHPDDYWRLTRSALEKVIFEGYEILDIEEVFSKKESDPTHRKGWRGLNPILCGLGRKL